MSRYTAQKEISFVSLRKSRALVVEANGGSLAIEVHDSVAWVPINTIAVNSCDELYTQNMKFRFTPTGGATYFIDEVG